MGFFFYFDYNEKFHLKNNWKEKEKEKIKIDLFFFFITLFRLLTKIL
jgi:hypothetical protein